MRKKLTLSRETLLSLDLKRAKGGTDGTVPSGVGCGWLPGDLTYTCSDGSVAWEN
jgi:hypothetical protein